MEATYELPDEFVVVYDYVPGVTAERLVREQGPLSPERATALAADVCEAVGALHACGIVHRDVTATNVVVAVDGAHLIDLGIARMRVEGVSHDSTSLGTWGYASPEQYGFAQTDARSDIYSVGRLLGFLLTGVSPSDEGFDAALAVEEWVPPELRAVIGRATAFEPSARYQSAGELTAALAGAGRDDEPAQEAVATPDTGASERKPRRVGVRAIAALGVAAALVVLAVVVGLDLFSAPADEGGDTSASETLNTTSGGGSVTSDETDTLEVSGLEWNVTTDGTLIYLLSLTNASDQLTAELPTVTLTGLDDEGNVTFSEEVTFSVVYPGETARMADVLDAGGTTEVTASEPTTAGGLVQVPEEGRVALEVSGLNRRLDSLGSPVITGLVTLASGGGDYSGVRIDAVERDDAGRLIGYGSAYPSMPAEGASTSFETLSIVESGSATGYEVYANPWW